MATGPASGYVWILRDPRLALQDKPDIVYIGNGRRPHESVLRHFKRSSNDKVAEWVKGLHADFPEGIVILGDIVVHRYEGLDLEIPSIPEGFTRIEWEIVGFEDDDILLPDSPNIRLHVGTLKSYFIQKYLREGHPLMNKRAGRPPDTTPAPIMVMLKQSRPSNGKEGSAENEPSRRLE